MNTITASTAHARVAAQVLRDAATDASSRQFVGYGAVQNWLRMRAERIEAEAGCDVDDQIRTALADADTVFDESEVESIVAAVLPLVRREPA